MRSAILVFCVILLSACASVDNSKKTITLDSATRHYERAIRWGEYSVANSLRRNPTDTRADMAHLKAIRVTSYEPVAQTESVDRTHVDIDVEIHYYNEYTMKEVKILDHQSWEYDPVEKTWYITSPLPAFK